MEDKKMMPAKEHKAIIDNRKKITLTSVTKALSANDKGVILQLHGHKAHISGSGLHIAKLDVDQGVAEVEGHITGLKYVGGGESGGGLKRLWK